MEKIEGDSSRFANFLIVLFLVMAVSFIVYQNIKSANDAASIKQGYVKDQAWIVSYSRYGPSDAGSGVTIRYGYSVDSILFTREVSVSTIVFPECEDSLTIACAAKRFWVIYSKDDPDKSLINLKIQTQSYRNPPFPESLDDFR
jgi:hypothetical protein